MEKYYEDVVRLRVLHDRPADEIERFRNWLPGLEQALDDGPLWRHAKIKVGNPGFLCVAASGNFRGANHAEQMVYEFPLMRERRCGITM
jgi:hypothetical protein